MSPEKHRETEIEQRSPEHKWLGVSLEQLKHHKDMFDFPGLPPVTKRDVETYYASNKNLERSIPDIVRNTLTSENFNINENAAAMISYVPEEFRAELIELGLQSTNWRNRRVAAEMIGSAPLEEQERLRALLPDIICDGLDGNGDKKVIAEMITYAPESEQGFLQEKLSKLTNLLPPLIREKFSDDWQGRQMAAENIEYAPESEQGALQKELAQVIREKIDYTDIDTLEIPAKLIQYVSKEDQEQLKEKIFTIVRSAFDDGWPKILFAVDLLQYIPEEKRDELWDIYDQWHTPFPKEGLKRMARETPLYKEANKRFVTQQFEPSSVTGKTGAQTTLLDVTPGQPENTLRERVIVRHFPLPAYNEWKRALEAVDLWKARGFEYVPIEPIIRARPGKDMKTVDVATRVIPGPSVGMWEAEQTPFWREIEEHIMRIKDGLDELGIEHGHLYRHNFVLYFPRTPDGDVDVSVPPRVYAIDFDAARPSLPQN